MARESEMIRNGGGLIDVTLCDGFLYCASVFSKSIAKATFSFPMDFKTTGLEPSDHVGCFRFTDRLIV